MKRTVYNIEYDTDGIDVNILGLPEKLEIEIPKTIVDKEDIEQYISDEISNMTGYCHFGFLIEGE